MESQGSYQEEEDWAARNFYQTEASMKKLICEEMSKQSNTGQNAPSIVAKLMGIDPLPVDTKSVVQPVVKKSDNQRVKFSGREKCVKGSNLNYSKQREVDYIYSKRVRDAERWNTEHRYGKPRPREHPQEEELQKFKKEFEAWQVSRLRECSKIVDVGSIFTHKLAQEKLNMEKMALYDDSVQAMHEKPLESKRFAIKESGLHHRRHKSELFTAEKNESRRRSMNRDFQLPSMIDHNGKLDAVPTTIVILKPGPDSICDHEESCTSSFGTFQERTSMEDFLEEVRERLKLELQGKGLNIKKSSVIRGSGTETPFSEKPSSDPKQIAKHIANQVRENVSRDIGRNLFRSEPTRSYRSEVQFNGPGSLEFITKDTRRLLSERLRNVHKQETQFDVPIVVSTTPAFDNGRDRLGRMQYMSKSGNEQSYRESVKRGQEMQTSSFRHGDDIDVPIVVSTTSAFDNGRDRLGRMQYMSKSGNEQSYQEIVKHGQEMQTSSFRHGDDVGLLSRELSPRNLIRSLSAPVSGTSFGKLLLEDCHILTGAQIRRKHEGNENASVDIRRRKKEKFNLKEKVSNIKYSLTLRRRLFGKKIQSVVESYNANSDIAKDVLSGPTVIMNIGERHENSTEVPPSPASFCSSTHEEFWREVDYLSPISTPDVTLGEDNVVPQVFNETSSNLKGMQLSFSYIKHVIIVIFSNPYMTVFLFIDHQSEQGRQLNELESDGADHITVEQEPIESEMVNLEDHTRGYVRDLLVASGLYDESYDKSLSRWDPLAKPIGNSIFEQVEEYHTKLIKENDKKVDHKVLLDLSNEALSTILGPPVTMSRFRRKLLGSSILTPPHGRKLINSVWEIVHISLHPPNDRSNYSVDHMVARDLGSTPWAGLMDDETNVLGREVEWHIVGDLVEEIVKDMHSRVLQAAG
ncbi:Protein piccolo [Gossypium australe]|uniref:Protein piccolo n=1 Tax=Gossypium australe TaxID=47621 RepID=A0A5B6UNW7_9ROSI|nr:Protein piccolo [Gossypium australe]